MKFQKMSVTEEVIWSDGPASAFKSKYMRQLKSTKKYRKTFVQKFWAASLMKGVMDGVGTCSNQ